MYYDECIIKGEMFYKTSPEGGWIRATNRMLTERLEKAQNEAADAHEVLSQVQALIKDYGI